MEWDVMKRLWSDSNVGSFFWPWTPKFDEKKNVVGFRAKTCPLPHQASLSEPMSLSLCASIAAIAAIGAQNCFDCTATATCTLTTHI
jgi:hypothetical protein